mgnify:CR=1 FL=1
MPFEDTPEFLVILKLRSEHDSSPLALRRRRDSNPVHESDAPTQPITSPPPAVRVAVAVAVAGFALAALGCYLPWVEHPAAALAPNAFDLAEWTSLHPAVRGGSPPLLLTLLLRAPFALAGVGIALAAPWGWLPGLVVALTLLPPMEFFRGAWGDPNFRQGFALTLATGALVLLALPARRLLARVRWALPMLPALLGIAAIIGSAPPALALVNEMYAAGYGHGVVWALAGFALVAVGVPYSRFRLLRALA